MSEFDPHSAIEGKDKDLDGIIRPQELGDFTGQGETVSNLRVYIKAARMRGEPLDHTLFHGPPGLGKTTLAHIIANEMGVNMKITSGPVLDRPGDLAGLLTSLETGDVLFIDEIHRLSPEVEEYLYSAMEDYVIDIMIDKGPGARSVRISLNPFTLVGATTRSGLLTAPLRERFGITCGLEYYDKDANADKEPGAIAFRRTTWKSEAPLVLTRAKDGNPSPKRITIVDQGNAWPEGVSVATDLPPTWERK